MDPSDRIAIGDPAPGEQAIYLFALIEGAAAFVAAGGAGERFAPPVVHHAGSIAALISIVSLSDYCSADAARHLNDLAWLAPRTLHHAAVLRQAMACSPVYPAPFATLFAGRETLTAFMRTHERTVCAFFAAVAGMAEWELKASANLDSRAALEALARDAWPDWAQLTPGTRYLRLCRDRADLIAARRAGLHELAARLVQRLRPPVTALRQLPVRPVPDASGEPVGRFALLLPFGLERALARRVQALGDEAAAEGITFALSGPWPPFSFRPDLRAPV